jgi:adenylate kinase family enzyme
VSVTKDGYQNNDPGRSKASDPFLGSGPLRGRSLADTDRMKRISVVGNTGSGKTTVAEAVASDLGLRCLELDSVFHRPDWQPLDTEEFRRIVAEFTAAEAWVVDGNYPAVSDIVWSRADTVVWLDPPRHRLMRQLVPRTVRRMAAGTELWNGNRERWRYLFRREESILLYAWTNHRRLRAMYESAQADPENAHLSFVRLRTPEDIEALLTSLGSSVP